MTWIFALCTALSATGGNGLSLQIDGKPANLTPPPRLIEDAPFVPLNAFAQSFKMEAKTVVEGKLVVLCTDGACRPVYLSPIDVHPDGDVLFIRLAALARAVAYEVSIADGVISLTRITSPTDAALEVGSVLPDVVLTDLAGRPVHMSDFIGRRILICTWASW